MSSTGHNQLIPVSVRALRSAEGEYLGDIAISLNTMSFPRKVIFTACEPPSSGNSQRDFSTWDNAAAYLNLLANSS